MKKRLLSILLAGTMIAVLTACGGNSSSSSDKGSTESSTESSEDSAEKTSAESAEDSGENKDVSELKVGIVMKSSDEFQNAVVDGAKAAAVEAGIPESNFTAVASNSESDSMQQVTAIEDMVSNGVDILLNACQEENALLTPLQNAADKGVKVVMVDTDCPSFENKVTYIGTDNYQAAYEGATEFASRLEEGSKVVILRGKLGDVNHEKRTEGLTDALEDAGMTVLEAQDANCETDKAANAMESFMTKYAGEIDGVMVTSDSMAVGAAQAIKSANQEGIKICGFDGFQSAIQLVDSGEIEMIIAQTPYEMGYDGVNCGLGSLLDGEEYESYISAGIAIIDNSNCADYLK